MKQIVDLKKTKDRQLIVASIESPSMSPTLRTGEKVLLKNVNGAVSIGNVIGFISVNKIPIIHRVVRIKSTQVQTMADRNLHVDPPVKVDQIVGKLSNIKIKGKWKNYNYSSYSRFVDTLIANLSLFCQKYPRIILFQHIRSFVVYLRRKCIEIF